MAIVKLNDNNFENEVIAKKGTALVDFYADWCGPCKMIAPIIEKIAEERSDIIVGKANVDDASELAARFGVMSIPTLIVFKDGKEAKRIIGYRAKEAILAELD
ncbi:MAG: thioredoxin [Ruminococcaceae bacterium]|nr:thioredoxin [Oscillospiraceae bacterium]